MLNSAHNYPDPNGQFHAESPRQTEDRNENNTPFVDVGFSKTLGRIGVITLHDGQFAVGPQSFYCEKLALNYLGKMEIVEAVREMSRALVIDGGEKLSLAQSQPRSQGYAQTMDQLKIVCDEIERHFGSEERAFLQKLSSEGFAVNAVRYIGRLMQESPQLAAVLAERLA